MDHNNLVDFFESFDDQLIKSFPSSFTFAELQKQIEKGKISLNNFKNYIEEEKVEFTFTDELIEILNVIRTIMRNPKLTLETYKEVKNAASVGKMSSIDLQDTSKRADFWKQDESGMFRPEKMYADAYEEGLIIYENRFILFLINQLESFVGKVLNYLYTKVRFINQRYINNEVSMSELKTLDSLCDFKNFTFSPAEVNARKNTNKTPLLTLSDAPFLKTIQEMVSLKSKIRYLHSTSFYKIVSKAKPLKSSEVHMSNIMADSPTYSKCFRFYKRLLILEKEIFNETDHVLTHAYKDYVLINIMLALSDLGYEFPKEKLKITQRHILIDDPYIVKHPSGVICAITASHRKVNLEFEVTYQGGKFHKQLNLETKRRSLINFDVCANISDLYQDEPIETIYKKMVLSKVDKGFTNSFVVTPYCSNSDDNIIFLSPIQEKAGSHLRSALIGCTIFVEGDPIIYHSICPVCGNRIEDEEDDEGNVRCPHCTSIFSFLRNGDHFNYKDTIWIKRLNKGAIKEDKEN